jgi:hypothetical protein
MTKRKMTDKPDDFGIALYYPFINVQDIEWLKCALLYWDAIRCIAPEQHYFNDEIKYLSDEGAIIATNPKPYSLDASVTFVKKIQKYCHNQGALDAKVRNFLEERFPELKDLTIHSDKFCESVFREMGHKVVLGHFEGGASKFYHAQPYITALYLTFLAMEMSTKINAPMLTDVPGLSDLGQYILWSDNIIPPETQRDSFLMQLDVDFPASEQLVRLSFEDILRFRQQRNDERRRFRKAVEEIRGKAQELDDPSALSDYLNEQKQEIQQSINDHRKALNDIGIKNFTSSLKIAWPCLFGVAIGEVAGGVIGLLSAIGMVGISLAKNRVTVSQERHKEIKNCPWHYLISLEQELR